MDPVVKRTLKQRMRPWLIGSALGGTAGTAGYIYLASKGILPLPKLDQPRPDAAPLPLPILQSPWEDPVYDFSTGPGGSITDNYYNYLL